MNYIERMELELSELTTKIDKLTSFMNENNEMYEVLTDTKKDLLLAQVSAMRAYHTILGMRIEASK